MQRNHLEIPRILIYQLMDLSMEVKIQRKKENMGTWRNISIKIQIIVAIIVLEMQVVCAQMTATWLEHAKPNLNQRTFSMKIYSKRLLSTIGCKRLLTKRRRKETYLLTIILKKVSTKLFKNKIKTLSLKSRHQIMMSEIILKKCTIIQSCSKR